MSPPPASSRPSQRAASVRASPPLESTPVPPDNARHIPYSADCCRCMDRLPIVRPLETRIIGDFTEKSSIPDLPLTVVLENSILGNVWDT